MTNDKAKGGQLAVDQQEPERFGNHGGQTRQKVELRVIITELLEGIRAIDGNAELARGEKTKRIARLAEKVKTKLYEDRRRKPDSKLQASTYRRYLTTIRKAITEQNWRHHSVEETALRLAKRFPRWADRLQAMAHLTDITPLRLAHKDLLAEIRRAGESDAYDAVSEMKLDHEVMRHLVLPGVTKVELAADAAEVLETKATNTVTIGYHQLMASIAELLTAQQLRGDHYGQYFSHLALGLALATGRRQIEILKLGRFKKVGEFELEFSGQAKQRQGVDYSHSYRIYSLIKADMVLEALERLRAMPEVAELQALENDEVNRRVAKTLNTVAKRVLGSDERVFKDSRAIWARIVFETHFATDARWKKVNETVFWREMLGHEDLDTQESYKQFKIDYTVPEQPAESASRYASRLEGLEALDDHPSIAGRAGMMKIHDWVKATIKATPEARISQKAIATNVGSYRPNIKEYLAIAEEALAAPAVAGASVAAAEVPASVARAKPFMRSERDGEEWVAIASINGVDVASARSADRMTAMREAFSLATA